MPRCTIDPIVEILLRLPLALTPSPVRSRLSRSGAGETATPGPVFTTQRLSVRKAEPSARDARLFYRLWTSPEVMAAVGFPRGIDYTEEQIMRRLRDRPESEPGPKLVVELKSLPVRIGECKLGVPNAEGISETDVKLLPRFWGRGLGTELKQGLVDYLFRNTNCRAVKATPNRNNIASQKMQEAVGGKRVGEGLFKAATNISPHAVDVPFYEYLVYREDWERRQPI
ncbi:MAG: GNAT family N-acetyltransferase [bacterium]|nr:GNAT family N-acetyltransferase [bacterium]